MWLFLQAASAESRAKEKAIKFADAERSMNRKNEVLELQKSLADREKQVSAVLGPYARSITAKC
jgi:hypothetical protein